MNRDLLITPRHSAAMNAKVALAVVLACETFFFGTVLSAYVYLRETVSGWPVTHASAAQLVVPVANTLLLALSALPMAWAGKAVDRKKIGLAQTWLAAALVMGLLFIGGQVFEFSRSGMSLNDQAFGGVFFTLMGFHALHILAGIILVIMLIVRTRLGDFKPHHHVAIDVSAWFWYYVIGVWVVLFAALYLL